MLVNLSVVWDVAYDLHHSHVFENDEWLPFITDLQAAQAGGDGLVISRIHTTVTNSKYGIEAGRKVKVVWSYLGRATNWESQLSDEMQALVVPVTDPSNQANTIAGGPFASFPHYSTALANINIEKANLLADFTGWVVYRNQNLYREALGLPLVEDDTASSEGSEDEEDFGVGLMALTGGMVLLVIVLLCIAVYYFWFRSSPATKRRSSSDHDPDKRQYSSEMTTTSLRSTLVKEGDVLSSSMA